MDEVLTIREAVEVLRRRGVRVTGAGLRRACLERRLPARQSGSVWLLRRADLEGYRPTTHQERGQRGARKRWGGETDAPPG
jgi:hypothetical protein